MAKYIAVKRTLLSHLCRVVEEGEEFEAEFPADMKLTGNIVLAEDAPAPAPKAKKAKHADTGAADLV